MDKKPILNFPNYFIHSDGTIENIKGKIIKPQLNHNGYWVIHLHRGKYRKVCPLHRIIAIHFIPNPENKPAINHINGITTDNRVENLEWCTLSENSLHAYRTGLRRVTQDEISRMKRVGKEYAKINGDNLRRIQSKPVLLKNKDIEISFPSVKAALETIGSGDKGAVRRHCKNKKPYKGYNWEYIEK